MHMTKTQSIPGYATYTGSMTDQHGPAKVTAINSNGTYNVVTAAGEHLTNVRPTSLTPGSHQGYAYARQQHAQAAASLSEFYAALLGETV